jgi:hypothetical protein
MSSHKIVGFWEGVGKELQLTDNITKTIKLKLIKEIRNSVEPDAYVVTDTYYYEDGSINYGPATYLIHTDNKKEFICPDEDTSGNGLMRYELDNTQMKFAYILNGISGDINALNAVYTLFKKDSKPLYKSVSTTKANIKLQDGSIITATATASATGHSAYEAELASKDLSIHNALEVANAVNKKDVVNITTDTHTDSVVTNL